MIFYSWNVNGFRAILKKGFWDWFFSTQADVICLQETKVHPEQLAPRDKNPPGYTSIWNYSKKKKGYSGVACFCRQEPEDFYLGFPSGLYADEGRMITLVYPEFYLLNVYFPNGQMNEERLKFKLGYYEHFLEYCQELKKEKELIICGDFNTAHREIDLKNPKQNETRSGFLPEERKWLDKFIAAGFVDTFRMFVQEGGHYTWWDYRFKARERNAGWRIDYFFVSAGLKDRVKRAWIEAQVYGSDHCPIGLEVEI
ncbi:MAG TPA: exodeoxyribonuclease III [Desulfonauticus sp.]|jgi:exodeoxyribonuclease-3|nr:MAG: Exodeoxyribonuclease III [Desulfonauticus sp. 38_4375]MDK2921557.1 exodeoxyribonuclease [Desulfonauticus sp.]HCO12387.1 exodeoxyribonuclease III [Desulfonauticus sp.]